MNSSQSVAQNVGLSQELLKQIIDAVVRHSAPKRIILYGSRARGDYSATSDIDIAVECEQGKNLVRNVIDDEVRTLLKLEMVDIDEVGPQLRSEIEREGILLYEKV